MNEEFEECKVWFDKKSNTLIIECKSANIIILPFTCPHMIIARWGE